MCGLAGVILGRKRRRREELRVIGGVFTELLLLSQRRGTDAAGVAVIRRDGAYRLLKRPGLALDLVADKLYWRVLDLDNKVTVILGHTRQKTRGSEHNNRNNVVDAAEFTPEFYAGKAKERADFYQGNHTSAEKQARGEQINEIINQHERANR